MDTVNNMDIKEFKALIYETVKTAMSDILEDAEALGSQDFIESINEARQDYKNGNFTSLEEIDV